MIMASPAMNQEVNDLVRSSEGARNAIQREDWGIAQRMLTEAQTASDGCCARWTKRAET